MYGSQVITVTAQFGYAAITSRMAGPSSFGSYAIALSVSALVTLLSAGGVAQAVARMATLDELRIRALLCYSILVGGISGIFVWLSAPFWAELWGDPSATPVLQLLAWSALIAPISGVGTSVMRRQSSFRLLSSAIVISNVMGMLVGIYFVVQYRNATSLAVSAVVSQFLLVLATLILTKRVMWGFAAPKHARDELAFGGNLTAIKVAEYLIGNITKFSVSRWLGASYFGYWNRADMLATLPFQQVQTALLQVISPEFRHDIDEARRARRVWTDLLVLVSWVIIPLSFVAAVVLPDAVHVLFGPGWDAAAELTVPLAISAGLQTVSMVLATAVETLGRFRWMWITSCVLLVIQALGAVGVFVFRDLLVAMITLIGTQIIRHAVQVVLCGRRGFLDVSRLLRSYAAIVLVSAGIAAIAWTVTFLVSDQQDPLGCLPSAAVIVISLFIAWLGRKRLPPVIIAQQYGLLRKRGTA